MRKVFKRNVRRPVDAVVVSVNIGTTKEIAKAVTDEIALRLKRNGSRNC